MTEIHAENLSSRISEYRESFDRLCAANDWDGVSYLWLKLHAAVGVVIDEARRTHIENDAIAAELETYRPKRSQRPPAPVVPGYCYVHTGSFPWACVAVELRKRVWIPLVGGTGYHQDFHLPDKATLCGKKTAYPVNERFENGGWPRMHELCSECTQKIGSMGLVGEPTLFASMEGSR